MKPGDIVFVMHHKNWISRAIAWFMQSKFSHCAVVIGQDEYRTYLCETSDFEVTIGYLEAYLDDPTVSLEVWSPLNLSTEDRQVIVNQCMSHIGSVYGYLQLLSFAVRALLKRVGVEVQNFIRQGWVCDENVLSGYSQCRASEFYGIDPKSIETQELYRRVSGSPQFGFLLGKAELLPNNGGPK